MECTTVTRTELGNGAPAWLAIAHVCHHWRAVAFHSKYLWRHITTDLSALWATRLIQLSDPVPIIVEIFSMTFYQPHGQIFRASLLGSTSRLHTLHFYETQDDAGVPGFHNLEFTTPAPLLENLKIEARSGDVTLIDGLFASRAPSLRRLQLSGPVHFAAILNIMGNLCDLELLWPNSVTFHLDVLRHTPLLERLKITVIEPLPPSGPVTASHSDIELRRLKKLSMDVLLYEDFLMFFNSVTIPETVQLRLQAAIEHRSRSTHSPSFRRILNTFVRHTKAYRQSTGFSLNNLWVDVRKLGWEYSTWATNPANGDPSTQHVSCPAGRWYLDSVPSVDQSTCVSLDHSWDTDDAGTSSCPMSSPLRDIEAVLKSLKRTPTDDIRTAVFSTPLLHKDQACSCEAQWTSVFNLLPKLRILKLSNGLIGHALSSLMPSLSDQQTDSLSTSRSIISELTTPLPKLKSLEELVLFISTKPTNQHAHAPDDMNFFPGFEDVLRFLTYRHDAVRRLKTIHVDYDGCQGSCGSLEAFDALAPLVSVGVHCVRCGQWRGEWLQSFTFTLESYLTFDQIM